MRRAFERALEPAVGILVHQYAQRLSFLEEADVMAEDSAVAWFSLPGGRVPLGEYEAIAARFARLLQLVRNQEAEHAEALKIVSVNRRAFLGINHGSYTVTLGSAWPCRVVPSFGTCSHT